ncbi:hypothetical protein PICSAR18_02760 [Mycobacterium avium subsp. paratuberculosis]|nr:hypothetical protein PICSAR18_02760 [Mycobacterium avium subsp. paratuberculosis]
MTDHLEVRISQVLPALPPDIVAKAFQAGATVSDLLHVSALTGTALTKAKLYLPQIRRDAVRAYYDPRDDIRQDALAVLAMSPAARFAEKATLQLRSLRADLDANRSAIGALCGTQKVECERLAQLDDRIVRAASSSVLGSRSLIKLVSEHDSVIEVLRANFGKLLALTESRGRMLTRATEVMDSALALAGCGVTDIHSSGGTNRTPRTIYKRAARLGRTQTHRLKDEWVTDCKALLGRLADYADATEALRQSIDESFAILQLAPGRTTLALSPERRAWTDPYWTATDPRGIRGDSP